MEYAADRGAHNRLAMIRQRLASVLADVPDIGIEKENLVNIAFLNPDVLKFVVCENDRERMPEIDADWAIEFALENLPVEAI